MNQAAESLIERVLKKDDDSFAVQTGESTYELTTFSSDFAVPLDDGPTLAEQLMDPEKLSREAHNRPARVHVRIVRYVFAGHALFSSLIMSFSYLVYYLLSFDTGNNGNVAAFCFICFSSSVIIVYALIGALMRFRTNAQTLALCLLAAFAWMTMLSVGSLAAFVGNIVPIQAGTMCFAQCMVIYAYTLGNPDEIDPLYSLIYMIIAAIVVWFLGLYGFIMQDSWISAGCLFLFGALGAGYLSFQIRFANRFNISECNLALLQFYMDPLLWLLHKV